MGPFSSCSHSPQTSQCARPTTARGQGSLSVTEIFTLLNFHSSVLWEISGLVRRHLCKDALTHQVLLFCHGCCKDGHLAIPHGLETLEREHHSWTQQERQDVWSYFCIIYPKFEGTSLGNTHFWMPHKASQIFQVDRNPEKRLQFLCTEFFFQFNILALCCFPGQMLFR